MAKIESEVEPDCVADYFGRESVSLVGIHHPIVSRVDLTWQYLAERWFPLIAGSRQLTELEAHLNQVITLIDAELGD